MGSPVVFIATPAYSGALCVEYVGSLLANMVDLNAHGIVPDIQIRPGLCYVHLARNEMTADFLASEASHLLFWDDDVGAPADGVRRLIERDRDIVAGVYPKKKQEPPIVWPVRVLPGTQPDDGLIECEGLPTGFMCIKRHVIAAMADRPGQRAYYEGGRRVVDLFQTGTQTQLPLPDGPQGPQWWGEDYYFTALARSCGFRAWMEPDLTLTHSGRYVWQGNYAKEVEDR